MKRSRLLDAVHKLNACILASYGETAVRFYLVIFKEIHSASSKIGKG